MLRECLAIVERGTGKPVSLSRCLAVAASCALILLCSSNLAMSQTAAQPAAPQGAGKPAPPPQVTCERGLLMITAENSSLADILNAVRLRVGASVEFPPAASGERATVRLGPAPPAKVLADLLRGSPFDYVVVGSAQELNRVQVVLSEKTAHAETPSPARVVAGIPDGAIVSEVGEAGIPNIAQPQLGEEPQTAIAGAFIGTPVDETVFTLPGADVQPGATPRRVRPSKENPRYFPPLKKQ